MVELGLCCLAERALPFCLLPGRAAGLAGPGCRGERPGGCREIKHSQSLHISVQRGEAGASRMS